MENKTFIKVLLKSLSVSKLLPLSYNTVYNDFPKFMLKCKALYTGAHA